MSSIRASTALLLRNVSQKNRQAKAVLLSEHKIDHVAFTSEIAPVGVIHLSTDVSE
jgi:hypothetical protein